MKRVCIYDATDRLTDNHVILLLSVILISIVDVTVYATNVILLAKVINVKVKHTQETYILKTIKQWRFTAFSI